MEICFLLLRTEWDRKIRTFSLHCNSRSRKPSSVQNGSERCAFFDCGVSAVQCLLRVVVVVVVVGEKFKIEA